MIGVCDQACGAYGHLRLALPGDRCPRCGVPLFHLPGSQRVRSDGLAAWLRGLRERAGVTQEAASVRVGKGPKWWQALERRGALTLEGFEAICVAFDADPNSGIVYRAALQQTSLENGADATPVVVVDTPRAPGVAA